MSQLNFFNKIDSKNVYQVVASRYTCLKKIEAIKAIFEHSKLGKSINLYIVINGKIIDSLPAVMPAYPLYIALSNVADLLPKCIPVFYDADNNLSIAMSF